MESIKIKDAESVFSSYKKGTPVHVKASINYNSLIDYWYEGKKYGKITNGNKIKWVYLKENEFGFDTIAYKGYEDPPQILELIKNYIDHNKMYEQQVVKEGRYVLQSIKLGWSRGHNNINE